MAKHKPKPQPKPKPRPPKAANPRALAVAVTRMMDSILISRSKVASQAGKTFGGDRDLYEVLGYNRVLSYADFNDRYRRGGIAGRIVDIPASATWRNSPTVTASAAFNKIWAELERRLRLYHFMERADKLSGIGHYGVMLIGAPGALEFPIPSRLRPEDVLFLSSFTEDAAKIDKLDDNTSSVRFGQPEIYSLKILSSLLTTGKDAQTSTVEKRVHHSRIIHIAEGLGQDEVHGMPRLLRVWNYFDDLEKVIGGSSEAIWRTVDRGIQFDLDKDAFLDPEDETDFAAEIEDYMHGLKRYIKTQGVTANVLGAETTDPRGAFETLGSLIAGTTGIPMRVLFGSERGQLASTQDERNFHARMKERQESFAEPTILRPFIDLLIDRGALPTAEYSVEWPDLSTQTRREQADVAARVAQAVRNIATQGAPGAPTTVISIDEFREIFLDLPSLPESEKIEVNEPEPEPDPEEDEDEDSTPPDVAPLREVG